MAATPAFVIYDVLANLANFPPSENPSILFIATDTTLPVGTARFYFSDGAQWIALSSDPGSAIRDIVPLVVSQQFNGAAPLPANSTIEHFYLVTTTGGTASIGQLLFDDGSGTGTVQVVPAADGREIITSAAFSGGKISLKINRLYRWDTTSGQWEETIGAAGDTGLNTSDASVFLGAIVRMSAANLVVAARADSVAHAAVCGVYQGVPGSIAESGPCQIFFSSGLGAVAAGDTVYLAGGVAGEAVNVAPSTPGRVILELGTVQDASGYDNALGGLLPCIFQPKARILLNA